MAQSALPEKTADAEGTTDPARGLHVAVIMDGNGRWAQARGRPRVYGHRRGVEAVRRVVEAAPDLGVSSLTLYTFSSDNWKRPADEVLVLMELLGRFLRTERAALADEGVRLIVIGRRDRLDGKLVREIEETEAATAGGRRMLMRLAVDYSSRDMMIGAMRSAVSAPDADHRELGRQEFAAHLGRAMHAREPAPDVDLLIRTGGERRLSDFLLWECAYAELSFTPKMWPDFGAADLAEAVSDFRSRDRRFGNVPVAV